jgi:hypothetical protein
MAPLTDFSITCPGCGSVYKVPLDLAGADVTCQVCDTDFSLPETLSEAAQQTPQSGTPASMAPSIQDLAPTVPDPKAEAFATGPEPGEEQTDGSTFVPVRKPTRRWQNLLLFVLGAGIVLSLAPIMKTWLFPDVDHPSNLATVDDPPTQPSPAVGELPEQTAESQSSAPPEPAAPAVPPPVVPGLTVSPAPEALPLPVPVALPPAEPVDIPPDPPTSDPAPVVVRKAIPITEEYDFAAIRKDSRKTLELFLLSSNPAERLAVCQRPEKIRAELETYYQTHSSGPLPLEQLALLAEDLVPDTTLNLHLYNVLLKDRESPIPVSVEETRDGFRVDWQTFIESYEHRLRTFFSKPIKEPGQFRVLLRRAHYFGPPVPGMEKERIAFSVEPPMRDESFHVWADKDSRVFREKLASGDRANWEAESYIVVELVWRGEGQTGQWVGLQKIISDSWRME